MGVLGRWEGDIIVVAVDVDLGHLLPEAIQRKHYDTQVRHFLCCFSQACHGK